jgi:DNA-binding NtrC family response regulator
VTNKTESVLLIVDDERTVCRALTRLLDRSVSKIQTATNPREAEIILRSGNITHVICDHWFGPGQPLGLDLVGQWKETYQSIKCAVVLTGTDVEELSKPKYVDEILPKVIDPDELIAALGFKPVS